MKRKLKKPIDKALKVVCAVLFCMLAVIEPAESIPVWYLIMATAFITLSYVVIEYGESL